MNWRLVAIVLFLALLVALTRAELKFNFGNSFQSSVTSVRGYVALARPRRDVLDVRSGAKLGTYHAFV